MNTAVRGLSLPPSVRAQLQVAAGALLAVTALVAPLAFGSTEVWGYCVLQGVVAVAAACWSLGSDHPWRRLWLPVAVAALGAAQLIPLPDSLIERLSPLCHAARQSVRELTERPVTGGVSVNAAETWAALRRCLMAALVVVMAADLSRIDRMRKWLTMSIAISGAGVLALGLFAGDGSSQKVFGVHNRDGYWKHYKNPLLSRFNSTGIGYADRVTVGRVHYISNSPIVGTTVGVMINANHFAVCIGLTLPVVLGWLASWAIESRKRAWLIVLLAVGYAALAAYLIAVPAHARGGVIALGLTGLFVSCLALSRTPRRAGIVALVLMMLLGSAAIAALGMNLAEKLEGRSVIWPAAVEMFRQAPWLGVGMGGFASVYPALRPGPVVYVAHNAWLESASECGVIGVALVASITAWLVWRTGCVWNWSAPAAQRALRLGVIGGILFGALHGALDHSIQIPANAYLCALLVGILVGDMDNERCRNGQDAASRAPRVAATIGRIAVWAFAGFLAMGAAREYYADRLILPLRHAIAVQRKPRNEIRLEEQPELLRAALPDAERAFAISPQNAVVAEFIGQAFLHLSRGRPGPELDEAAAWITRSLNLCPVTPWNRQTLLEIRVAQTSPEPPPDAEPAKRRSDPARKPPQSRPPKQQSQRQRATNARPDRSAP